MQGGNKGDQDGWGRVTETSIWQPCFPPLKSRFSQTPPEMTLSRPPAQLTGSPTSPQFKTRGAVSLTLVLLTSRIPWCPTSVHAYGKGSPVFYRGYSGPLSRGNTGHQALALVFLFGFQRQRLWVGHPKGYALLMQSSGELVQFLQGSAWQRVVSVCSC